MNHLGDTNKMVKTPRIDYVAGHARSINDSAILAEGIKLERELNRACEMYRKLDIHALNLVDRIRRLEEAGDAMADMMIWSARITERESPSALAWLRAKEDKP
jgi:hypothetical protein